MLSKPLLTVAIPAYNVEKTLEKAVDSIVSSGNSKIVEILIVNDGSTDDTKTVASVLAAKHHNIKVINKSNGGHGSTINSAIAVSSGKYFRLLDGDDWFDKKLFADFLKRLKEEKADLVLCDHMEINNVTGKIVVTKNYNKLTKYAMKNLDDIVFPEFGPLLSNSTIKTSILKSAGFKIDENCYYVDQEYNLLCYMRSNTAVIYDCPAYQYLLGQDGQSMNVDSLKKNVLSHEKVCLRLLSEYTKNKNVLSSTKRSYIEKKMIIPLCHLQYTIAINYCASKKAFLSFDKKLANFPEFYNAPGVAGSILKLHRKTKGATIRFDSLLKRLSPKH